MSIETPETLLDRLVTDDILIEAPEHGLSLSEQFRTERAVVTESAEPGQSEMRSQIRKQTKLASLASIDPKLLDTAVTIRRLLRSLTPSESVITARMIRKIEISRRIDGVPSGFLSLGANELPAFIWSNPAVLVFCWRENSEPCTGLKADLERLQSQGAIPSMFGLGATYGPSNVHSLRDNYDVAVAPTLLFCVDGRIDCRLVGHHDTATIRNEIQILAESLDE